MNSHIDPHPMVRQRQAQVSADLRLSRNFLRIGLFRLTMGNALIRAGQRMRGPLPILPLAPART